MTGNKNFVAAQHIARSNWTIFGVCLLIGIGLSLSRGQDNFYDLINYHIYNAWSLLNHRYDKDLFVAGKQTYFSPFLDIPYYLASIVWLSNYPRIVAALAGLPFGGLIFATTLVIRNTFANLQLGGELSRTAVIIMTTAAAVTGTATWFQIGITTNEITVAAIVLPALALLVNSIGQNNQPITINRAVIIGALLGLAAGLKLTATIYAPACGLLLLAACTNWRQTFRCGAAFFFAWLLVFLFIYGPWGWHLYMQTGDPLFPMFNSLFHSPYAPQNSSGRDLHHLPSGILQWIFYPFYWLHDQISVLERLQFRDARFAAAYVFSLGALVCALIFWKRRYDRRYPGLTAIVIFWIPAYVIWLVLFSILRYAVALEICASIITVGILIIVSNTLSRNLSDRLQTVLRLGMVFALVSFLIGFARIPDFQYMPYGNQTFSARIPPLGNRPLIVFGTLPMGIIAVLIHQKNSSATFIGIPSYFQIYSGDGIHSIVQEKIARHRGPLYVAYYADHVPPVSLLARIGVWFSQNRCYAMQTNRTADIFLCPASYSTSTTYLMQHTSGQFRLIADVTDEAQGVSIQTEWKSNFCTLTTHQEILTFNWRMPADVEGVNLYVQSRKSAPRVLVASTGSSSGSAKTGNWVSAGQNYFFMGLPTNNELARVAIRYVPCVQ